MNKKYYENGDKVKLRYATRKYSTGLVSLMVGATIFFAGGGAISSIGLPFAVVAHAEENTNTNIGTNVSISFDATDKTFTITGDENAQMSKNEFWQFLLEKIPNAKLKNEKNPGDGIDLSATSSEDYKINIKDPIALPQDSANLFRGFKGTIEINPQVHTENVTNMSHMFEGAENATPDTTNWKTDKVTDMSYMFSGEVKVDASGKIEILPTNIKPKNTTNWNTENVTNMAYMFAGAKEATPDTTNWKTDKVTNMTYMFEGAKEAEPNTSGWNTENVTNMAYMFEGAAKAKPDTRNWKTDKVTDMSYMFSGAVEAEPNTSGWNTENVTNMVRMFENAAKAKPDTSNWKTDKVIDMQYMFAGAVEAEPNTSGWNTENVTDMQRMFLSAKKAKPDTTNWKTGKVTNMSQMFYGASEANPNTSGWDTSNVTDMNYMFAEASKANPDTTNWKTGKVTDMSSMFYKASEANPNTSGWDTSNVTNMGAMFQGAKEAEPNTSGWNTENVTNMQNMFSGAVKADPDVTNWDVKNVKDMSAMFYNTSASPDVSKWEFDGKLTNYANMFGWAKSAKTLDLRNFPVLDMPLSEFFHPTKQSPTSNPKLWGRNFVITNEDGSKKYDWFEDIYATGAFWKNLKKNASASELMKRMHLVYKVNKDGSETLENYYPGPKLDEIPGIDNFDDNTVYRIILGSYILFDLDGGEYNGSKENFIKGIIRNSGDHIQAPDKEKLTKEHKRFKEWYLAEKILSKGNVAASDEVTNEPFNFAEYTTNKKYKFNDNAKDDLINDNIMLKARWVDPVVEHVAPPKQDENPYPEIYKNKIHLDGNSGTLNDTPDWYWVAVDYTVIKDDIKKTVASKEGEVFWYWSREKDLKENVFNGSEQNQKYLSFTKDEERTLYAHYGKIVIPVDENNQNNPNDEIYVKVTFDPNGGTLTGKKAYWVAKGYPLKTSDITDTNVTRKSDSDKDYAFTGWTLDNNAYDFDNTKVERDITLKANWKEIHKLKDPITEEIKIKNGEIITPDNEYDLTNNIPDLPTGAKVILVSKPDPKLFTKESPTHNGTVKVTFEDGSSVIVEVPVHATFIEDYPQPTTTDKTVKVGTPVNPEELLTNKDDYPTGTTVTFKDPISTDTPGDVPATIIVKVPDGPEFEKPVTVHVLPNPTPSDKIVPVGTQVDPKELISNTDKFPETTTYEYKEPGINPQNPGKQTPTVVVKVPGLDPMEVATNVTFVPQPEGKDTTVPVNTVVNPENLLTNKDKFPKETKVTFKDPISTENPGDVPATVVVEVPNGPKQEVSVTVHVVPQPTTTDKIVPVGTQVDPKELIGNTDKFPEGTTYEYKEPGINPNDPGKQTPTVVVKVPGLEPTEVLTNVTFVPNPEGKDTTVPVNTVLNPEELLTNKEKFPEGTKVSFKEPVSTENPGDVPATIVVEVPNGPKEEVSVTVHVVPKDPSKTYDVTPVTVTVGNKPTPEMIRQHITNLEPNDTITIIEPLPDTSRKHPLEDGIKTIVTITHPGGTATNVEVPTIVVDKIPLTPVTPIKTHEGTPVTVYVGDKITPDVVKDHISNLENGDTIEITTPADTSVVHPDGNTNITVVTITHTDGSKVKIDVPTIVIEKPSKTYDVTPVTVTVGNKPTPEMIRQHITNLEPNDTITIIDPLPDTSSKHPLEDGIKTIVTITHPDGTTTNVEVPTIVVEKPPIVPDDPQPKPRPVEPTPDTEKHNIEYKIVEGDQSNWTRNSKEPLKLKADGRLVKLSTLVIDGKEYPYDRKNSNDVYTVSDDLTTVYLKTDFLESLTDGPHTFEFKYVDGHTNTGTFYIKKLVMTEDVKNVETNIKMNEYEAHTSQISPKQNKHPDTGDNNHLLGYCVELISAAGALYLARKKKEKENR